MRTHSFPLLLSLLLVTGYSSPICRAQAPDAVITVTRLPYPKAKLPLLTQNSRPPHPVPATANPRQPTRPPDHQTTLLPDYGTTRLESCIQHRHTRLREAELATLQESKKGRWLKYLPTVRAGLAPTLRQNQDGTLNAGLFPTLSIGLNSSLIYQAHRDKQQRQATHNAIIQRSQLQQDLEIAKLHRLLRRLQTETDKLTLQSGVADVDRQLFSLYQQQYENHDISPEEYLLKRKAFLQQELRNQDQIARIEALRYEIEELAGCLVLPTFDPALPSRK